MKGTSENSLAVLAEHYEQTIVDEATTLVTYVGFAEKGIATSAPYWMIMKIEAAAATSPTGVTTIKWAGAYKSKTNIWDDRATLSYTS